MIDKLKVRLRGIFLKDRVEAELDEEVRYHVERDTERNLEAGMNPGEARAAALGAFGREEGIKEECRDARGVRFLDDLKRDLHYGWRMLARNPGFASIAVVTLALGIGANTTIFSVLHGVILESLPFPSSAQLVRVYSEFPTFPGGGLRRFQLSPPELLELQRDSRSWASLDGWVTGGSNLTGSVQPVRIQVCNVTGGLLASLGVGPKIGRLITHEDDMTGHPQVAVISYGLWKTGFGGDPGIAGRDVLIDGVKTTVVGVMPSGFEFPTGDQPQSEMWMPLQIDPANPGDSGSHYLSVVGRLRTGLGLPQARAEMEALTHHYAETASANSHVLDPTRHPIVMYSFKDEVVRKVRPALFTLAGAAFFVLLIACVNVANLLLARAEVRQRETALRLVLGASTRRLARQFVSEGLLLSSAGGLAGLAIAFGGLKLMAATNAGLVPRIAEVSLDWRVLLFTLGTCVVTALLFGAAPLAQAAARNLHDPLKSSGGRTTASVAAKLFRKVLVATELALALVLLVGSGLMIRGFWRLLHVDPGFAPSNLLTMRLLLSDVQYNNNKQRLINQWSRLQERLSQLPGIVSASLASSLPPQHVLNANDTSIEGLAKGPGTPVQNVDCWTTVTPEYFQTMGMGLVEGRFLTEGDGPDAARVVVINETMARHFFGSQSPIGRRVMVEFGPKARWSTIVGVVADVRNAGLDKPTGTELFIPYTQDSATGFGLVNFFVIIRTKGDPGALTRAASDAIHNVDPALPVSSVQTMDGVMSNSESQPRFITLLLGLFSAIALILASVGIYGLMSYLVTLHTNEIGIRMALGAEAGSVLRLVLGNGMRLTLAGLAVGLAGSLVLTRLMTSFLFGVTTTDPGTFASVPVFLAIVALLACYVPARRATQVDPIVALRYE